MSAPSVLYDLHGHQALPIWFDVTAMSVNCLFGAAVARNRNAPIFATIMAGLLVGLGGGMVRDMLLGLEPAAISGWYYIPCGILGAIIGALVFHRVVAMTNGFLIANGLTLGVLVTIGAQKALDYQAPIISAIALGVVTASFGGMLADVFAGYRASAFRQAHWVASSLVCGSIVFVAVTLLLGFWVAVVLSVATTATLRFVSQKKNWPSPHWPKESLVTQPES